MRSHILLVLAALCIGITPPPLRSQGVVPETPAGRRLNEWLAVVNRGDAADAARFQQDAFVMPRDPQGMLRLRQQSGGLVFDRTQESIETKIVAVVNQRSNGGSVLVTLETEPTAPYRIARLELRPGEAGAPVSRLGEAEALAATLAEAERRASADRFSGAILIGRGDTVLFERAYGFADREGHIANISDTKFRLGSMNKMFTAVAIAQLAETGKLAFSDSLAKHVPDYPNKELATRVTIDQLLTHTAGTGDIFGPEYVKNRGRLRNLSDYVAVYGSRGLEFEPGSRWSYSNYGFVLLGVIIERASGQSYYDYVREHVYRPAGMSSSDSFPEGTMVPGLAIGYMKDGTGWKPNTDTLPLRGNSAGGGHSTVGDLWRFSRALRGYKLLNAPDTELVTTGKVEMGPRAKYGYGFGDIDENGVRSLGHNGGAPGMNAELKIYPRSGYVVAVLANLDPPAATEIANFIGARLPAN